MSETFNPAAFKDAWDVNPRQALQDLERRTRQLGWGRNPTVVVTLAKHHTRLDNTTQARAWLYPLLESVNDGYVALHLANTFRFDVHNTEMDEAIGHAQRALTLARGGRDGPLALAALLALTEFMEAIEENKRALEHAGEAMGIAEALGSDTATVEPLVALSRLHTKNGVRGKAEVQAQRALYRSETSGRPLEQAWGFMALAYARGDEDAAKRAFGFAMLEHHLPLARRAEYLRKLAEGAAEPTDDLSVVLYPALPQLNGSARTSSG